MKVNILDKIDKKTAEAIRECIEIARLYNFKIYLVGGIVRDILLKKPLKDVDITVEGNVKSFIEVLECHFSLKFVKYNDNLPTANVVFTNGIEIDFASTRKEAYKHSGELPKIVQTGCSLKEDVLRRDFTVNAIAISLNSENLFEIIDFLGGVEDLKNKQLRVLHEKSFTDDPSRIIRGMKFSERLHFDFEEKTFNLIKNYIDNPLVNIPFERIKKEIKELFSLNKNSAFNNFIKMDLYKIFVPKIITGLKSETIRSALFDFNINDDDIWLLYFLPLFILCDVPKKLNFTASEYKIIKEIREFYSKETVFEDKYSLFEYFKNKEYLSVVFFGIFNDFNSAKTFLKIRNTKIEITGQDLKNLGITPGKIFSEIQKAVLKEKLNNGLKDKNAEIDFIKRTISPNIIL